VSIALEAANVAGVIYTISLSPNIQNTATSNNQNPKNTDNQAELIIYYRK
jgi:hypothetical protein